jgi:hypothetical protein
MDAQAMTHRRTSDTRQTTKEKQEPRTTNDATTHHNARR